MRSDRYEVDMCNGPLLSKILLFSLPVIASGILQLMFNAADMVVAGRYAGAVALAAVGATSSLINLLINVFIGLSIGANVTVAHFYGAGKRTEASETVHTAMAMSVYGGLVLSIIGIMVAEPVLKIMGTPDDIIAHSVIYMRIYFIGMPVTLIFNFGSAVLRALGDTKRPLYYLSFAGIINVILNLFFIVVFKMGVAGVALATIISQGVSSFMIVRCMVKSDGIYHLDLNNIRISKDKAERIIRVGLPAGLQGAIFNISNVLIQSSVNSFGSIAVAGNTAQSNIEGFVYNSMNSYYQTALSFTGQNVGARKYDRVIKSFWICMACVFVLGAAMGWAGILFGDKLLSIYSDNPEVVAFGLRRMRVIFSSYFLCGMQEVMVAVLRGMGYSIMPTIVCLLGVCAFRTIWIFTVFRIDYSPEILYASYPISWILIIIVFAICFVRITKQKRQEGLL